MKKLFEDKRTMCYVVKDFISMVPGTILESMPEFNMVYSEFIAELETVPEESESQTVDRTGQATLKSIYKSEMVIAAVGISSCIKAYAVNTNNVPLAAEMSKRYAALFKRKDTVCADLCNFIRKKGDELLGELGTYGVTAELLSDLKTKRLLFIAQLPKPRMGIMERKTATEAIEVSIGLLSDYLKRMDTLVDMKEFTDAVFYKNYYSARKIVHTGHRTLSILGRVEDVNGMPLSKVEVLLKGSKLVKKSGAKGGFEFKNLESKVYDVIFRKAGFADTVVKVAVTATERSEINVVLAVDMNNPLRLAS